MKRFLPSVNVLLVAFLILSSLMLAVGVPPLLGYRALGVGTFGSGQAISQVLFRWTPLLLTGLAVLLPLRAGLFNIGAEGQVIAGGFVCAIVGAALPESMPRVLAVIICLGAAAFGGAIPAALSAIGRTRFEIHEVISGLLLNLIVRALLIGAGTQLFVREQLHTAMIVAAARLPRLAAGSAVNVALLLAIALTMIVPLWLARSRFGFGLRAVGENPDAAFAAGWPVDRLRALALVGGGALAGLASANFVLGYKYYYEDGFSGGVGFLGLAVALLGGTSRFGLPLAALLLAALAQGGLAMNALVPREVVDIVQAVLLAGAAVAIVDRKGRQRW